MASEPIRHSLGFGNGKILEYPDGTAAYVKSLKLTQSFRVRIADVTGFSVTKYREPPGWRLEILGNRSTLADVVVSQRVAQMIEQWFRDHKLFYGNAPHPSPTPSEPPAEPGVNQSAMVAEELQKLADELRKLARLRSKGIISDQEFEIQKAKLLGR